MLPTQKLKYTTKNNNYIENNSFFQYSPTTYRNTNFEVPDQKRQFFQKDKTQLLWCLSIHFMEVFNCVDKLKFVKVKSVINEPFRCHRALIFICREHRVEQLTKWNIPFFRCQALVEENTTSWTKKRHNRQQPRKIRMSKRRTPTGNWRTNGTISIIPISDQTN